MGHQGPRQPTYRCPLTKPTARPGLRDTRSRALSHPSQGLSLCPTSRRFTPLGLQGPLLSADPGLSLLPRERGFSLPASGMGIPGWQEQGHSLQGPLVLPPQEGPPIRPLGHRVGAHQEAALVPGPKGSSVQGASVTSHSVSLPQIQLLSFPAHSFPPSQLSGDIQVQTGPEPTETRLTVVTPSSLGSHPCQAACRREAEMRSCPHHLPGVLVSPCCE